MGHGWCGYCCLLLQMSIMATRLPITAPAPENTGATTWKPLLKVLAVLAGYSLALCAACAMVAIRQLHTQGPDAQASAGMYAAGDAMLFVAVFGTAALLPTGLGLYYLRPFRSFWIILTIAALPLAATGPVCAGALELLRHLRGAPSFLQVCEFFGVMRVLGAPLLAACFFLCACLAPTRFPRWALLGATAVEGLVSAYAVIHWFILPRL